MINWTYLALQLLYSTKWTLKELRHNLSICPEWQRTTVRNPRIANLLAKMWTRTSQLRRFVPVWYYNLSYMFSMQIWQFLGTFAKLWKVTISFIYLHELGSYWMYFHEIWVLLKICTENSRYMKISQIGILCDHLSTIMIVFQWIFLE
jgi:hypothetical protein